MKRKCKNCSQVLQEVLVYKGGARRRSRVIQCPNHCDLRCPQCDETVRVRSISLGIKTLACRNCPWSGRSLQLAASKNEKNSERVSYDEEADVISGLEELLSQMHLEGLRCPSCEGSLEHSKDSIFKLGCTNSLCRKIWPSASFLTYETSSQESSKNDLSTVSVCGSCSQPIRNDSRCGCS